MKTNVSKSKSMQATLKQLMSRKKLTDDELDDIWEKVDACFGDLSEAERVRAFRRFWQSEYEITVLDKETDCLYSSSPLMRVFTISHDQLAQGYLHFKGETLSTPEDISAAATAVKLSIESAVRRQKGVMKASRDLELGYSAREESTYWFYGFQEGFGSDEHLIGMFFSEAGRAKAIAKIIDEWGKFGVRTEPLEEEWMVHARRAGRWKRMFGRQAFRRKFAKLSDEERRTAIEELSAKGIKFKYTDHKSYTSYQTCHFLKGGAPHSRCFSYDFRLGYSEESLPTTSERRDEIDHIERSLFDIIAQYNGFVTMIERSLEEPCMDLRDSKDFLGSGRVYARFPDDEARRRASAEVFGRLAVYGVSFPVEDGEELSVDEQIAVAHDELAEKRKELEWASSSLDDRKQQHREEVLAIEVAEQRLREEEIRFKEFEKEIAERLQQLNQQRNTSELNK